MWSAVINNSSNRKCLHIWSDERRFQSRESHAYKCAGSSVNSYLNVTMPTSGTSHPSLLSECPEEPEKDSDGTFQVYLLHPSWLNKNTDKHKSVTITDNTINTKHMFTNPPIRWQFRSNSNINSYTIQLPWLPLIITETGTRLDLNHTFGLTNQALRVFFQHGTGTPHQTAAVTKTILTV